MSRQNVINSINEAIRNRVPYASSMATIVNSMQLHQKEYFFDQVAPYYLDGPGKNQYGTMYKDMEYMARAVSQNKDVSNVLGIDYRQLGSIVQNLPDISMAAQTPTQTYSQARTDADRVAHINQLIDDYVIHTNSMRNGISNSMFCQSANVEQNQLPLQGWKFHISANNLQDYEQLLEKLCPEFDALGISYKVVRPERLMDQINSEQIGKAVTIYPTPALDFNRLSPELKSMLNQDGIAPIGDAQIQGRIYARYGKFRGGLVGQDGHTEQDLKHQRAAPDFVKERTVGQILNFYSDCNHRYAQTNDAKTYLQELATMTRGDGKSNAFITLTVDEQSRSAVYCALSADPNKNSCIYELNGHNYMLLHNDYANEVMRKLDEMGVVYERPNWDRRYGVYTIHPDHADAAINMVEAFNSTIDRNEFSAEMNLIYMDNGMIGVEVDTSANRAFNDLCQFHGIAIREEMRNISMQELEQQEIDMGWERAGVGGYHAMDLIRD